MPRLLLVRHGQTDWNKERRFQGQTNIPLNYLGRQQVRALGKALAKEKLDAIWASDLQRAVDTAQAVAEHHGLAVQIEPRLREFSVGDWEGLTGEQIRARDPELLQQWDQHASSACAPNGESIADVAARVDNLLADLRQLPDEHTLVLAAHGGLNSILICLAMGFSLDARRQFSIRETSITELHLRPERTVMVRLNDTHHLNGHLG